MYHNQRILDLKAGAALAAKFKKQGKKLATTNGCFDLLHIGHVTLLKETARHGDVVFLGLNSDHSVRLSKGNRRPIQNQRDRAEMLLTLPWVDYVVIFPQKDCIRFVDAIKPHFHINDSGYGYDCIERETVKKNGGKLVIVQKVKCKSTTDIITMILKKYQGCR